MSASLCMNENDPDSSSGDPSPTIRSTAGVVDQTKVLPTSASLLASPHHAYPQETISNDDTSPSTVSAEASLQDVSNTLLGLSLGHSSPSANSEHSPGRECLNRRSSRSIDLPNSISVPMMRESLPQGLPSFSSPSASHLELHFHPSATPSPSSSTCQAITTNATGMMIVPPAPRSRVTSRVRGLKGLLVGRSGGVTESENDMIGNEGVEKELAERLERVERELCSWVNASPSPFEQINLTAHTLDGRRTESHTINDGSSAFPSAFETAVLIGLLEPAEICSHTIQPTSALVDAHNDPGVDAAAFLPDVP